MSDWIIPTFKAGKEIVKHKDEIHDAWQTFVSLFKKHTKIAVTGMPGVGKTVLFDYISGRAYSGSYIPPYTSEFAETGKLKINKKHLELIVVPGQRQKPRFDVESKLLKDPPEGIIHVVASGYASIRHDETVQFLLEKGIDSIAKLVEENLQQEIDDLKKTYEFITSLHKKHSKPSWIVVAVNKVDLFADKIKQIYESYVHKGEFVEILNKLKNNIGSNNIRWKAFHVCCRLEAFTWANDRHMLSIIDENQRDVLIKNFINSITNYCER